MTVAVLDLVALEPGDLRAIRLGAQVMGHKAALVGRPRVEGFFAAVGVGADGELARRDLNEPTVSGSVVLAFDEPDAPADVREDRRLLSEYLDLLRANPRLTPAVRGAWDSIRDQLGEAPDDGPELGA